MEAENALGTFLNEIISKKMFFHVSVDDLSKNRFVVKKILTESEFKVGDAIFRKYFIPATAGKRNEIAFYDPTLTCEEITTPDRTRFPPVSSSHPLKRKRYGEKHQAPINEQKAASNLTYHYQNILYSHLY